MLKLPAKVIQTKPSPQEQRYFLQRYTANVELYQETLKQYLQPPIEVTDATMAIEYLTKAIQAATKATVPTQIIKPNYKPPSWSDEIKNLLDASKEADATWKKASCPDPDPLQE